jgi:hypothetical protein
MKKLLIFFMFTATICILLVSCSKSEVTKFNVQNPDVIGFSLSTSRAPISTVLTMQSSAVGFEVYATNPGSTTAWYTGVNGTENYGYDSGSWGWVSTGNPTWPTTAAGYPMNFYAMYPSDGVAPYTYPNIQRAITIAALATNQIDHLAARAIDVAGKPGDGRLSMTFNHILSKIDFGIVAGYAKTVILQESGVQNVHSVATYDYVTGLWGSTETDADYEYYKNLTTPIQFTGTDANEATPAPIYAAGHSNHLMLMPQTAHITWDPTGIVVANTVTAGSFASLTYRLTNATDDEIGYTNAGDYEDDYPGYLASISWLGWSTYTALGSGADRYNDALFIKVGFPLAAANFTWTLGKGYTYNISLGTNGSCNGYYTAETYFDKDGNDTGIPVIGSDGAKVEIGDPVTDGIIHFKVIVTNWDDTAGPTPLP